MTQFMKGARVLAALLVTVVVMGLLPVSVALAQEGTGYQYSDEVDLTELAPATGVEEQVSAPLMVTLAYGFIWLLLAGLVYTIWRRGQRLSVEIDIAQQRLAELDSSLAEHIASEEARRESGEGA
jgi:hypothetical protein